ncbi:MAG: Gfo/Idh/MocA family protein [Planctomycetota bacterium]
MSRCTRRGFLKQSSAFAATAATLTIAGTKASGQVLGANDTIRIGVAGINGRGRSHIKEWMDIPGVQVTYLIDPDSSLFASRTQTVEKTGHNTPKCVQDIRQALEDKELDAVSVATCNHWHSLITIWACQAGKDVYVEKPCSHNVFEGRKCVEAAQKYGRIVQHGTQQRGSKHWQRVKDIAEGKYGKLLVSRGQCFKKRTSIGFKPTAQPPSELDFDIWLGPAPLQPYHENLVHYNWHWFWDTGNGDIGNQGVHEMDVARWMIPGATLPKSVICLGGRYGYEDQGQTPNTQLAVFDYGDAYLLFEVRGLVPKNDVGNSQYFDEKVTPAPITVPTVPGVKSPIAPRGPGDGIFANFIECVRSRKTEDQDAHILEGHYSAALCHLANISFRLGEAVPFSRKTGVFGDNKIASSTFGALQEHLKDNGIKLEDATYQLGRHLKFDAATEKFVDDAEADKLLRREYRAPYVVPEEV